ncbi:MAG: TetR/AcrR family transcriptional regulator, partial [Ilumatobacteraceae bacterium]
LPDDSTPADRLEAAIRAHTTAVLRAGDLAAAQARLGGQVPDAVSGPYRAQQRAYGAIWDDLLADAGSAGAISADVDLLAARLLIFGALNWTSEWFRPTRSRTAESVADTAVDMLLDGLLGTVANRRNLSPR